MQNKAIDKLVNDVLSKEKYEIYMDGLSKQASRHRLRIEELRRVESGFMQYCRYGLALLCDLRDYYQASTLECKQKMVGLIFPEKLIYSEKTYRTTVLNEVLELLCRRDKGFGRSKNRKGAENGTFSFQVVSTGVEPPIL